jgi:hypothetical protein
VNYLDLSKLLFNGWYLCNVLKSFDYCPKRGNKKGVDRGERKVYKGQTIGTSRETPHLSSHQLLKGFLSFLIVRIQ